MSAVEDDPKRSEKEKKSWTRFVNVTVPWGNVTYFQLNMGHLAYNHPETKVKSICNLDIVL